MPSRGRNRMASKPETAVRNSVAQPAEGAESLRLSRANERRPRGGRVPPINYGDTAWVLASSALVLLMTPGLALFYGGMSRSKSVLNMLMMNFATIGVVSVLWVFYGYSLAFTTDRFHGLIGGSGNWGLRGLFDGTGSLAGADGDKIPTLAFCAFQLMFAIITPALISGAVADRMKFKSWLVFVAIWATIVYLPVAHWVFFFDSGNGGWIADHLKAFDFAGGTAVHVNAGAAGPGPGLGPGERRGGAEGEVKTQQPPEGLLRGGPLWVRGVWLQTRPAPGPHTPSP